MSIRLIASAGLVGSALAGAALFACADSENADAGDAGGLVVPPPADGAADQGAADAGCGNSCADASRAAWPFTAVTLPIDPAYNLFGAWGSAKDDVWLVGAAGAAVHFDGTTWTSVVTPTNQALYAVWGRSATDVWATCSAGVVLHRAGTSAAWQLASPIDANNPWTARAIFGVGTSALFVAGSGSVGNADEGIPFASVMAAGRTLADGGVTWRSSNGCLTCTDLYGLWGTGEDNLWVVGENGAAQQSTALDDGGAPQWTPRQTFTRKTLHAVWGSSPSDVWAVGDAGTIVHWTNDASARWTPVSSGTTSDLEAVWGSGPSDVWAVGDDATVLHYDGSTWSPRRADIPTTNARLHAVWGSAPDDVWIVGRGVALHSTKVGDP